jgi:hypothetical protein
LEVSASLSPQTEKTAEAGAPAASINRIRLRAVAPAGFRLLKPSAEMVHVNAAVGGRGGRLRPGQRMSGRLRGLEGALRLS